MSWQEQFVCSVAEYQDGIPDRLRTDQYELGRLSMLMLLPGRRPYEADGIALCFPAYIAALNGDVAAELDVQLSLLDVDLQPIPGISSLHGRTRTDAILLPHGRRTFREAYLADYADYCDVDLEQTTVMSIKTPVGV